MTTRNEPEKRRVILWDVFPLIILAPIIVVVVLFAPQTQKAEAATDQCWPVLATVGEDFLTSSHFMAQTFELDKPTTIESIAANIYSTNVDMTPFVITLDLMTTTAGVPTGLIGGTTVSISTEFPDGAVGVGQRFDCTNIPSYQRFTFGSPVALSAGTYAYRLRYSTSAGATDYNVGYQADYSDTNPGALYYCSGGAGCTAHTYFPKLHSGQGTDNSFEIFDVFAEAQTDTGTIDWWFEYVRDWTRLTGDGGDWAFGLGIIGIVFLIAFRAKVPLVFAGVIGSILYGGMALKGWVEGWPLIPIVAVVGVLLVFRFLGRNDET